MPLVDRRNHEIDGRGEHGEAGRHHEISKTSLYKLEIVHSYAQSDADDRSHKRGYEHCSDNDGCGIGVESERSDQYRHDEYQYIGTSKSDTLAYHSLRFGLRHQI